MIHPSAIVDPAVKLGKNVSIGPFAVVEKGTTLGDDVQVASFVRLGGPPAHTHDSGEGKTLEIGARTVIREHVSIHRGTGVGTGKTIIGSDCHFMPASHAGHDCRIGNGVTMTHGAVLGGHCLVEDFVLMGGYAGMHQYCRVGTMAMVAGYAAVVQDVPPYCMAAGPRARLVGLNEIGLERRGLKDETIKALRSAYRTIFRTGKNREASLAKVEADLGAIAEVRRFVTFIREAKRGVCRHGRE